MGSCCADVRQSFSPPAVGGLAMAIAGKMAAVATLPLLDGKWVTSLSKTDVRRLRWWAQHEGATTAHARRQTQRNSLRMRAAQKTGG